MTHRGFAILAICTAVVSACSPGVGVNSLPSTPVADDTGFRAPIVQSERGLESVIGKGARSLTQRFGKARINLSEGDARKLQFSSDTCVLDIFLYPLASNNAPVATHVEARRRSGGGNTDKAACIAEVERAGDGG